MNIEDEMKFRYDDYLDALNDAEWIAVFDGYELPVIETRFTSGDPWVITTAAVSEPARQREGFLGIRPKSGGAMIPAGLV